MLKFLSPDEIASWRDASLDAAGFSSLAPAVWDCWLLTLGAGVAALPPGLCARLWERLTHRSGGSRSDLPESGPARDLSESCERIVFLACGGRSFTSLEEEFLTGPADPEKVSRFMIHIAEKGGMAHHDYVNFTCDEATLAKNLISRGEGRLADWAGILAEIFRRCEAALSEMEVVFDATDLVKVRNPGLFTSVMATELLKRTMAGHDMMRMWLDGQQEVREDRGEVVEAWGEPFHLPYGGYESLTNKGPFSALVPSELAYSDTSMEVDLFDVKLVENGLLYFKRDEGAVYRIRRDFRFAFTVSPGYEHLRNLSLLLSFLLALTEKTVENFAKDIIRVTFSMGGYSPAEGSAAKGFFEYLAASGGLGDSVRLHWSGKEATPGQNGHSQLWCVGDNHKAVPDGAVFLEASLPRPEILNAFPSEPDRYRFLAREVNRLASAMWEKV